MGGRVRPIPIGKSELRIARGLTKDALEIINIGAMPTEKMPGAMPALIPGGIAASRGAMNIGLKEPAARIVRIDLRSALHLAHPALQRFEAGRRLDKVANVLTHLGGGRRGGRRGGGTGRGSGG